MESLIESASMLVLALLIMITAFLCIFYLIKRPSNFQNANGIEELDAKQYEDLKREYIRRKMAHSKKGDDAEETTNSLFNPDNSTR